MVVYFRSTYSVDDRILCYSFILKICKRCVTLSAYIYVRCLENFLGVFIPNGSHDIPVFSDSCDV